MSFCWAESCEVAGSAELMLVLSSVLGSVLGCELACVVAALPSCTLASSQSEFYA